MVEDEEASMYNESPERVPEQPAYNMIAEEIESHANVQPLQRRERKAPSVGCKPHLHHKLSFLMLLFLKWEL